MIAANFRKFPDAQLAQLELDLAGVVGASDAQRSAFWAWLMKAAQVLELPALPRPAWWVAAKARALELAKRIKGAIVALVFDQE